MVKQVQIRAIYRNKVFKPLEKLDLKEKTEVRITVRKSFSKLLDELGELEAKENVDKVLENIKIKNYYG